jgi:hypothetical protein
VHIPPANEYYLDYEVNFESGWAWVKGGKLPGLVGGTHTSGCADIVKDGWSARFMWHESGGGHFYYYHQNRNSDCGDVINFSGSPTFKIGAWNRITEHVVVNTPGQSDGSAEAWLNGKKVVTKSGIKWRGSVAATVAMVDQVSLQTFYGGSTNDWAPSQTTHALFNGFVVRRDLPDFNKAFEPVTTAIGYGAEPADRGLNARISAAGGGMPLAYLGSGILPALPDGKTGERLGLYAPDGGRLAEFAWDGSQWKPVGAIRLPERSGILFLRIRSRSEGGSSRLP